MSPVPAGACDCHTHVFDPRYPFSPGRSYTPGPATVEDLLARHRKIGVDRVVLVQPSPYGDDNGCLLDALETVGDRARGVVAPTPGAPLQQWDALGVRGVRINPHSAGDDRPIGERLTAAARTVAGLGWHVQVFARIAALAAAADAIARLPVPLVVDHMALVAGPGPDLDALLRLVDTGVVHVKLSAPERSGATPGAAAAVAGALLAAAPERMVWASDWPHTDGRDRRDPGTVEDFRPIDDAASLHRLREWCDDDARYREVLVDNPARLYGFAPPT